MSLWSNAYIIIVKKIGIKALILALYIAPKHWCISIMLLKNPIKIKKKKKNSDFLRPSKFFPIGPSIVYH